MAYPNIPLVNGQVYSWASVRFNIAGVDVVGVRAISYTDDQEIVPVYGAGNRSVGYAEGNINTEGSITLMPIEVQRLQAASPTGRIQDLPLTNIIVEYSAGTNTETHRLLGVKFMANSREAAQNDQELEVEIPLFIGSILWR